MNTSDKNLEPYIQKIFEIQNAQDEKQLSPEELRQIATELGFSDDDWQRIQSTFNAHLTRGHGYLEYDNWDDAITEFKEASILNPHHFDVLFGLATAYKERYLTRGDKSDGEHAAEYAKKCLQMDPAHNDSLRLISDLKHTQQKPWQKGRKSLIFFILASIFILVVTAMWLLRGPNPSLKQALPPKAPGTVQQSPPENELKEVTDQGEAAKFLEYTEGLRVPVRILQDSNTEGLQFDIESAGYNVYGENSSYDVLANMTLDGIEISRLDLKGEFIGEDGEVAATKVAEIIKNTDPISRSGDTVPVRLLEYSQEKILPALKEVRLSVSMRSKQPAPASYDPSQSVPITWMNKVPNIDIEVRERLSNLSQGSASFSSNGIQENRQNLRHEVVWEVQNTGKSSIKRLELGIQYLDKDDNLIELKPPMFLSQQKDEALYTKTVYIGSSNDPMLNPGQTRVHRTSVTLKGTPLEDFKEYTITVVEVK